MGSKDLKRGAVLSYILIVVNSLYGLLFTPYLISTLGDSEYGIYKIIGSLSSSLAIFDLGIGSTVLRYTAKFYAEKKNRELDNFSAMGLFEATIVSALILLVCAVAFFQIDNVYSMSLSAAELEKAKELFVLFTIVLILSTYEKVFFSMIAGCGRYTVANGLKLARLFSKLIISYLILLRVADSRVLLFVEIGLLIATILIQAAYLRQKQLIRIHLYHWDWPLFASSSKYTMLMFVQSIAVQFNGNLDNMVIGAYDGAKAVAVYSIGLQFFNMYEHFAMAFSDLMLLPISKQIADGAHVRDLENTVIKIGHLEFIMLGGALCGFLAIGREFIQLWLGDGYSFAWIVGLVLMLSTTVSLVQNVCLSIIRAQNKMMFRTIAVSVMAIFNLVFTILGVPRFGPIAACIGTAIGLIGVNIIAMNIYYVKVLKMDIIRVFAGILKRSWVCCLIAIAILILSNQVLSGSWLQWLAKVGIFAAVYAAALYCYGFNSTEKSSVTQTIKKVFRRA